MVQKNRKAVLIDSAIAVKTIPQDGYFTSHDPANITFAPHKAILLCILLSVIAATASPTSLITILGSFV
ncbi:hypothetical protein H6G06_23825 [Anabaena sphaerica FACHB-251]|uniref:Uncharacterized protein n=1 Tax=Anabaena sphaerica FACHB-251 TaxID=2692883 RepID=A0A926WKZ4_9NOST|nr:hypothetical protein [Anabaena sphaerica]MBD2296427.1 hypothetical protein [Anabaena sphaerica FACHB-251]